MLSGMLAGQTAFRAITGEEGATSPSVGSSGGGGATPASAASMALATATMPFGSIGGVGGGSSPSTGGGTAAQVSDAYCLARAGDVAGGTRALLLFGTTGRPRVTPGIPLLLLTGRELWPSGPLGLRAGPGQVWIFNSVDA